MVAPAPLLLLVALVAHVSTAVSGAYGEEPHNQCVKGEGGAATDE